MSANVKYTKDIYTMGKDSKKETKKEKFTANELLEEHYKSLMTGMCVMLAEYLNDFNKKTKKDDEITADNLIKYMNLKKYAEPPLVSNNKQSNGKHTDCMWKMSSGPRKGFYCLLPRANGETMCTKHVNMSSNRKTAAGKNSKRKTKISSSSSNDTSSSRSSSDSESDDGNNAVKVNKITIKKVDLLHNPKNGTVLTNDKNRKVIGMYKNKKLYRLTEADKKKLKGVSFLPGSIKKYNNLFEDDESTSEDRPKRGVRKGKNSSSEENTSEEMSRRKGKKRSTSEEPKKKAKRSTSEEVVQKKDTKKKAKQSSDDLTEESPKKDAKKKAKQSTSDEVVQKKDNKKAKRSTSEEVVQKKDNKKAKRSTSEDVVQKKDAKKKPKQSTSEEPKKDVKKKPKQSSDDLTDESPKKKVTSSKDVTHTTDEGAKKTKNNVISVSDEK